LNLSIVNSVETFPLGEKFKLSVGPLTFRNNVQQRFGKPGGKPMGDGNVSSRTASLKYHHVKPEDANADAEYVADLNRLAGLFRPDRAPFYIYDSTLSRRMQIVLDRMDDDNQDGLERRIAENNGMSFTVLDGFWEDSEEQIAASPTGGIENGEAITVDNDCDFFVSPFIRVIALNANQFFTLRNDTTGDQITISSASFVEGTEYEIDCRDGSIYLFDGFTRAENSFSMADGSGFPSFAPGINSIVYESTYGPAMIEMIYRRRYAF